MRRAPEIVFSDLDDSLLARDKTLPEKNLAALDLLAEKGIPFVPATGRAFQGIPSDIASHPATRYAVCSSGAVVADALTGEAIWSRPLGHERALALFERVRDLPCTFDIFCEQGIITSTERFSILPDLGIDAPQRMLMERTRLTFDGSVEEVLARAERIDRVGIFHASDQAGAEVRQAVLAAVEKDASLAWVGAHPLSLEITDGQASKGEALAWLCEHLGIDREASWAFGDSGNDVALLAAAGTGVALNNAMDPAKEAADIVCELDCDAGGVGQTLLAALGAL